MSSLFTKIIAKEIPAYIIAEDDNFISFLDINPVSLGHCLVVPKAEIDYVFEIDDDLFSGLFLFAKKIGVAIKQAVPCVKVGITVSGLEVPHAHIHLVPINSVADITFDNVKLTVSNEELDKYCTLIKSKL
ncbi:MAG: HIT family protein [Bacteroidota bacterium]|nr:HIT family protein [Bacteroidota bacterium]